MRLSHRVGGSRVVPTPCARVPCSYSYFKVLRFSDRKVIFVHRDTKTQSFVLSPLLRKEGLGVVDFLRELIWVLRLKLSLKLLLTEATTIICLILYLISRAKPDQKITRSFLFRVKDGKRMHFPLGFIRKAVIFRLGFIRKNSYACLTTPSPSFKRRGVCEFCLSASMQFFCVGSVFENPLCLCVPLNKTPL